MIVHRSGPLKQQNKGHKHGKHRSKGQRDEGGRVNVKTLTKKAVGVKRKNDRKSQADQLRKQKRENVMMKKRRIGSSTSPPHNVLVVALHRDVDVSEFIKGISTCDDSLTVHTTASNITHISIPRFKQRVEFVQVKYGQLYDVLDAAKVADSLLLLLSAEEGTDSTGEGCMSCLLGQGLPTVTLVTQGMKSVPAKKQKEARKNLQKITETWFPNEKVHTADTDQENVLILRQITSQKQRDLHFRLNRAHLLAESVEFDTSPDTEEYGTLKLTGYVRSCTMSANRLVHVTGLGDFQLSQIDVLEDPHPLQLRSDRQKTKLVPGTEDVEMEGEVHPQMPVSVVRADPGKVASLECEVEPDPMEGEQTWPTEEELTQADSERKPKTRRVPKGTSDYQALWMIDDDEKDGSEDEDDDDDDDEMGGVNDDAADDAAMSDSATDDDGVSEGEEEEEEYETVTIGTDDDAKYDEQMDLQEEQNMFAMLKKEKLHVTFPDEVDTPQDLPARTRFQKYRGLKSFRTSPWDRKENLPLDYARIFQFGNFKRIAKKIMKHDDAEEELDFSVNEWSYVRIHIANVPKELYEEHPASSPLVVFSLLPHEQKMSVINIVLRKTHDLARPIKSKDRLTFHIGCRRFSACPVFSQHTNGTKHKFERFLPQENAVVATLYAPITFPPAPVLVFQNRPFGGTELVAKGSLLSVDPDRIIVKRAVVSGYPFKINKKSCVVRYMFFNRADIDWFKPVELRTKWGRRGHIKEPLGTHGHMKCVFDGQLKSQDTVMMNLYKRVFPKWNYNPVTPRPSAINKTVKVVSMETIDDSDDDNEPKPGAAFAMFD